MIENISAGTNDAIEAAMKAASSQTGDAAPGIKLRTQSFETLDEEQASSPAAACTRAPDAIAASLD